MCLILMRSLLLSLGGPCMSCCFDQVMPAHSAPCVICCLDYQNKSGSVALDVAAIFFHEIPGVELHTDMGAAPSRESMTTATCWRREKLSSMMTEFVGDVKGGRHREGGWPNTCYGMSKLGLIAYTNVRMVDFGNHVSLDLGPVYLHSARKARAAPPMFMKTATGRGRDGRGRPRLFWPPAYTASEVYGFASARRPPPSSLFLFDSGHATRAVLPCPKKGR